MGNWTAMVHNPYGVWISGASSVFERQNVNVPVGLNDQYGSNITILALPLRIFTFEPKIEVGGYFANNETVTVRIRMEYVDNVVSNSVVKTFTNSSTIWLTNDDMLQLYPSQDVIWAILFDAHSNYSSTKTVVLISGFGNAG